MKKHLMIVPRWGGTPTHDWYPWISKILAEQSLFQSIHVCDMPNPSVPTITGWTDALSHVLKNHTQILDKLVLVGHSVGCHAVMHALQRLNADEKIDTAVFVAGWWDIDQPWESINPWINAEHDYKKIKSSAKKTIVLLSDNDPFTADYLSNSLLWENRLSSEIKIVPEAKHFNGAEETAVFQLLQEIAKSN